MSCSSHRLFHPHLQQKAEQANQEIYQKTKSTRPIKSAINPAQKRLIQQALESVNWSVTKAAKILGTTRQNLQYHIRKLGIKNHGEGDQ